MEYDNGDDPKPTINPSWDVGRHLMGRPPFNLLYILSNPPILKKKKPAEIQIQIFNTSV